MYRIGWQAAFLGVGAVLVQIQSAQALSKAEVSKVAQSVTVMIQNAQNPQDTGSGVIIKREGETYTVLTARHVVERSPDYKLMTPDEKQHPMVQGSIQAFSGVDLALVTFKSSASYSVVKMGDSAQSPLGTASFVAGFPGVTEVRSEPTFYFTSGEIAANASRPLKDGYAIGYNNPTLPGMSGGPVLNEQGELIGIHGRAERVPQLQNSQLRSDIAVLKTEFNYAIPINTFLTLAPQVNKTLALRTPSPTVPSEPKADDFFLQADEKLSRRDYKGAIADFDQVLRLNPSYEAAYTGRGVARGNSGDEKGAIEDLTQAIRINPNNVRAYAARGSRKVALGDKQGADADFKKALSLNIDPQDYRAYNNRGSVRTELGDKEGAIADYDQAIRLNPNFPLAYKNRGGTRWVLEDKKGALADYDQAIKLDPQFAEAYKVRGSLRSALGDKQGAISDYDQAIRLNPNDPDFYHARGFFRVFRLRDKKGALADYDQAIRLNTKDVWTYYYRALIRTELGDKEGAIADLNQAIRIDPNEAESYDRRARFRQNELKDKKGAIADYQKAADLFKAQGNERMYQVELEDIQKINASN
jgi:tetratricopeptide (TPR) repeat protein